MTLLDEYEVSNLLDIPLSRLNTWANNGKLYPSKFNGIKYYDKQSLGSFNRELILCFGCKKCFELQSNQIKLNCGLCNNPQFNLI